MLTADPILRAEQAAFDRDRWDARYEKYEALHSGPGTRARLAEWIARTLAACAEHTIGMEAEEEMARALAGLVTDLTQETVASYAAALELAPTFGRWCDDEDEDYASRGYAG